MINVKRLNVKRLVYAILMLLSLLAIPLLMIGITEGGFKTYEFFIRPYCTESTEATVLYYEGVVEAQLIIGRTPYTVVEMSRENGKPEEVKLKGLFGHREGDVLELHYNPENIKQFYIGEIQYAPEPPKPPETTLDKINNVLDVVANVLMVLVIFPVIILVAYDIVPDIVPDKNNEKNESL